MKLTARKGLHIGQLAKLVGVRSDTVRFYERDGLLARPERSAAGYRIYNQAALKRLRFIKQAQAMGFSLDEIRRILSLRGRGKETWHTRGPRLGLPGNNKESQSKKMLQGN